MTIQLTYDFSAIAGLVVANQIGQNFQDLNQKLGQIRGADVADDAGIRATQLADRYNVYQKEFDLVPFCSIGDTAEANWPWDPADRVGTVIAERLRVSTSTESVIRRYRVRARPGQLVWLVSLEVYCLVAARGGGANPRVTVYQDGTLIPGATFDLTVDDDFTVQENANPIDNPIIPLVNDNIIEYRLTRSSGAGNVDIRGVTVRETWKVQLTS